MTSKKKAPKADTLKAKKTKERAKLHTIRRNNARYLATLFGMQKNFADAAAMSESQLAQLIRPNSVHNIGAAVARRLEKASNKPEGWLDIDHGDNLYKQTKEEKILLDDDDFIECTYSMLAAFKALGIEANNASDELVRNLLVELLGKARDAKKPVGFVPVEDGGLPNTTGTDTALVK